MSGFNTFVIAFCTVCIFIGGLYILCPDGGISKSVKYIFCLIFILAVMASAFKLKNIQIDFKPESVDISGADDMNKAAAEYAYSYALKKNNINFTKITVCTDKTEDGSIIITKVIIYSDGNAQRIREALDGVSQNYEVEIINE